MLECLCHKWIDILLKGQLDTDPHGLAWTRNTGGPFVGCLHQSGPTTRNDVATQFREGSGHTLGFLIGNRSWLRPRRAENGNAEAVVACGAKPSEIIDHFPQSKD